LESTYFFSSDILYWVKSSTSHILINSINFWEII
jgi:hypothetical protein